MTVAPTRREEMIVIKAVEDSAHHGIAKMKGLLINSNATGKLLPDAKVFRTPGYFLSQAQQTGSDSSDRSLADMCRRGHVQIKTASQVERSLNRREDFGRKLDYWHKGTGIFSFRATKCWR
jgi:Tfp pilus assembly pilus retraction ATPase PilT